ncbi:asparagine synthase (glutamine-hydrolyzing) [Ferrovibrio terrae]|uniref:asparagine synthase (glutamine-hydrolyzing) n=1 Tax=Ferrovibrio terrae TaxID=2594003 RepID=A0A516GXN6_9PROT|nr:asparagine synthase (glutamine-hydrolyzing) [Ferrovibrio terrae]QDO96308.1 asparagine synthase (glutamine-hydrolyzing) [Ferrovibrio terrae]
MCGIFGMLGRQASLQTTRRALAVQQHRGPDDTGWVEIAEGPLCLGHNRLAIIDVSALGHQPMASADGRNWIVFNGEIYNYRELRRELGDYSFRSSSDTEVILAAYARWGVACLERFIGMFSFALWDGERQELLLARDRLGIKPLNYGYVDGTLVFASEIKAILTAGHAVTPDAETWSDYLAYGIYEQHDRTFFRGIRQLPAGCYMYCRPDGTSSINAFWDLKQIVETAGAAPLESDELEALMVDAVRYRLRSDVPLGVNISGGLDSLLLASMVDQLAAPGQKLHAATAGFSDSRYDERGYAREVISGTRWLPLETAEGPDMLRSTARVALSHQEAPIGGIATLAYHNLHEKIRAAGLTVQLEGQGLDEMFAGYAYYRGLTDGSQSLQGWLSEGLYQDGTSPLARDVLSQSLRDAGQAWHWRVPALDDAVNQALFVDITQRKLPRVLRMNDRLSMAHSIELRVPFLDHRLVEAAFRIPGLAKIAGGMSKRPLRDIAQRRHPSMTSIWSEKRAVVAPQTGWLRGAGAGFVEDCLESPWLLDSGLFDVDRLRDRFRVFVQNGANNSFFVWQWVNVALWCELFVGGAWRDHAVRTQAHGMV